MIETKLNKSTQIQRFLVMFYSAKINRAVVINILTIEKSKSFG